ncbi:SpoIVB peptidase S55 domain-containing protein [Acidicapsa dinghuensis]|uniref:SpoIVB peptidase S55 domain-containing protein n=1 Tax=Acidicapsa dinghuensis TaxID=2218256 RepID=A0ABW1EBF2_9BACT|nr:SpoIVB peptidase S55 domain-containing protein [Acidicapsa dinghuensis]
MCAFAVTQMAWGAPAANVAKDAEVGPPPSSVGFFPLSQIHRGQMGTAWTVFEGTKPEPMQVEILGVLHGARGPKQDLILARLRGEKPEFTGVVAGMSGSPVYIDGKLAGALSYRIGQFTKEPIAGITPIEQMMQVRDLPERNGMMLAGVAAKPESLTDGAQSDSAAAFDAGSGYTFAAMETPLLMSGFQPEAVRLWKQRLAGTGLDVISAGGMAGSDSGDDKPVQQQPAHSTGETGTDFGPIVPGSAVSLQLVRGDLEIAATCTVTYVDPEQLLACGHPIMQSGTVSLPMTTTEVVTTLASPLNSFKIVNTGNVIGAFTEDRSAAIRGEFGVSAHMIPVSISVTDRGKTEVSHVEVLDLPSLTPQAVLVSLYQILLENNESTADDSYHVTGEVEADGLGAVPVSSWGTPGETMASQLAAALGVADGFNRLYANPGRRGPIRSIHLHVETIPQDMRTELESVRLVSSNIVHAGDTVEVEATLRPWQQPERNVRIPFTIPARLTPGTVRLVVGGGVTLDRTLDQIRKTNASSSEAAVAARLHEMHQADHIYVSLLLPETEASVDGVTLSGLPLSMANSFEPQRNGDDTQLFGESVDVAADAPAGGVLNGQQILTLHVESGGGTH